LSGERPRAFVGVVALARAREVTMRRTAVLLALAAGCAVPAARTASGPAPRPPPGTAVGTEVAPETDRQASAEATPITRSLEAYLGRQIWVAVRGGEPEQWFLREIGHDHLTIERTRTYRVLPVRRLAEITWTDLTGIDPTPRIVLAPE
jgi:hypothetical protein